MRRWRGEMRLSRGRVGSNTVTITSIGGARVLGPSSFRVRHYRELAGAAIPTVTRRLPVSRRFLRRANIGSSERQGWPKLVLDRTMFSRVERNKDRLATVPANA